MVNSSLTIEISTNVKAPVLIPEFPDNSREFPHNFPFTKIAFSLCLDIKSDAMLCAQVRRFDQWP